MRQNIFEWNCFIRKSLGGQRPRSVKICAHNSNPCIDSGISATVGSAPNATYPWLHWDTGQVNVLLSAPPNAATGGYDVQLTSLGSTGLGFAAGPQSQMLTVCSAGVAVRPILTASKCSR